MAEGDAVAGAKPYPLDALVVAQRAMTAAEVAKIQAVRLRFDAGVLTRDLRVRHAQMALAAAPQLNGKCSNGCAWVPSASVTSRRGE